jgi:hypothetical protein
MAALRRTRRLGVREWMAATTVRQSLRVGTPLVRVSDNPSDSRGLSASPAYPWPSGGVPLPRRSLIAYAAEPVEHVVPVCGPQKWWERPGCRHEHAFTACKCLSDGAPSCFHPLRGRKRLIVGPRLGILTAPIVVWRGLVRTLGDFTLKVRGNSTTPSGPNPDFGSALDDSGNGPPSIRPTFQGIPSVSLLGLTRRSKKAASSLIDMSNR